MLTRYQGPRAVLCALHVGSLPLARLLNIFRKKANGDLSLSPSVPLVLLLAVVGTGGYLLKRMRSRICGCVCLGCFVRYDAGWV
jgi:hypothetical protein